ncbi:MAG TPA: hypothetical protein VEL31_17580 [Ktedonobacteraceae bacterium]|nr:hypothetical protein [Ktedonobacteraceae bacterium]
MSTQPPYRLEELEKAFAIFKQNSEAFERKYRAFEQDLRAHIEGLNHYATMTFGIVQTQEIDIREIKSILSENTSILNEHTSALNKHGKMLERILSLLEA